MYRQQAIPVNEQFSGYHHPCCSKIVAEDRKVTQANSNVHESPWQRPKSTASAAGNRYVMTVVFFSSAVESVIFRPEPFPEDKRRRRD
ncbi:hypothetical protein HanPSC8_Chr17g0757961 [Helianthus annuus]|nr:hypothetical protein HanPSC8_Chr17g0757961 [Helianthus annuus]